MSNTAILIVFYNKEPSNSETLKAIENYVGDLNNCVLTLWNNGPSNFKEHEIKISKSMSVKVIESIENRALSKIYNTWIRESKADRYIILDQDSKVSQEYLDIALNSTQDSISVPRIYNNNQLVGPLIRRDAVFSLEGVYEREEFFSVGSGIVIGNNVVEVISKKFGSVFDEIFVLYGVDASFWYRVKRSKLLYSIQIIHGFEHSLSRNEQESPEVTKFRMKERSYDMALQHRYFHSLLKSVYLFFRTISVRVIKNILGFEKSKSLILKYYVYAYVKGKHYRS